MDGQQMDQMARALARGMSRRRAVKGGLAALLGGLGVGRSSPVRMTSLPGVNGLPALKGGAAAGKTSATVHFQREYHRPNNAAIVQAGLGSQPTRLEIVRRFSAPPSSRLTPLT
jgi:hypothetical protein